MLQKDVEDPPKKPSKRTPDLTRIAHLAKILNVRDDGSIEGLIYSSRTVLVVEIKALQRPTKKACAFGIRLALRQAQDQAQHVFAEESTIQYLGLLVGCGNGWIFRECRRGGRSEDTYHYRL